jgi:hypothetical protein
MLLDATPELIKLREPREAIPHGMPMRARTDRPLALALYTVWAARTGRVLRSVPVTDLTPDELIDFWADDQLDFSAVLSSHRRMS